MIIPSFRLYHFAVKLIWKSMLVLTFFFWTGIAVIFNLVKHVAIWEEYGWWLFLMIFGTYFLFMDVRLMVMIMCHEEKKNFSDQLWYNRINEHAYSRYAEGQNFHGWR